MGVVVPEVREEGEDERTKVRGVALDDGSGGR